MTKQLAKLTIIVILIGIILISFLTFYWIFLIQNLLFKQSKDDLQLVLKNPIIQTEIVFEEPELEYLGNYKITYYCACEQCCGKTDGITATGTHATANRTIAVDPTIIPYGSQVLIGGIVYTAEDCGGAIKEKRIDIYVDTHEEALQKGIDYFDVYLLK